MTDLKNDANPTLPPAIHTSIATIDASAWNGLFGHQPFLSHAWFSALEQSKSIGGDTGWYPYYLTVGQPMAAATPLFIKTHSFGEFVFDFSWANAYQHHGLRYYPKAVSAVPFTPVTGKRLAGENAVAKKRLLEGIVDFCTEKNLSSWHALFIDEEDRRFLEKEGLLIRKGIQFHWHHAGWKDFDDFLEAFSHDKRKKIKQERRKLKEAGVSFVRKTGADLTEEDWRFFYQCYEKTYLEHGHWPYLNKKFFLLLWQGALRHSILLIEAHQHGKPIASAFFTYNEEALFGRYWGSMTFVSGLHFETCYYQGIEFCLEKGLKYFEAGAQGEHKIARGFSPVETHSAHWIKDLRFREAISRALTLTEEAEHAYCVNELKERAPYKRN